MDWFLYDIGLRHERVKCIQKRIVPFLLSDFVEKKIVRMTRSII